MPLFVALIAVLTSSGLLMLWLHRVFTSRRSDGLKVRGPRQDKLIPKNLGRTVLGNGVFSAVVVFVLCYGLYGSLFREGDVSLGGFVWEIFATLLLYDFLYYLLHRYPFHKWNLLRGVHTVHHKVRYPTAFDSLYLHPLENFLGLALLMTCVWIVGPVSIPSFAVIFLVYSSLNILVHCGLNSPIALFKPLSYMTRKHDRHHQSMRAGNFASITPLPDLLFGTAE